LFESDLNDLEDLIKQLDLNFDILNAEEYVDQYKNEDIHGIQDNEEILDFVEVLMKTTENMRMMKTTAITYK
jgi:hypothetical protein